MSSAGKGDASFEDKRHSGSILLFCDFHNSHMNTTPNVVRAQSLRAAMWAAHVQLMWLEDGKTNWKTNPLHSLSYELPFALGHYIYAVEHDEDEFLMTISDTDNKDALMHAIEAVLKLFGCELVGETPDARANWHGNIAYKFKCFKN